MCVVWCVYVCVCHVAAAPHTRVCLPILTLSSFSSLRTHTCIHTCTYTRAHTHTHTLFPFLRHPLFRTFFSLSIYPVPLFFSLFSCLFLIFSLSQYTHTHTHTHRQTHTHTHTRTHNLSLSLSLFRFLSFSLHSFTPTYILSFSFLSLPPPLSLSSCS